MYPSMLRFSSLWVRPGVRLFSLASSTPTSAFLRSAGVAPLETPQQRLDDNPSSLRMDQPKLVLGGRGDRSTLL